MEFAKIINTHEGVSHVFKEGPIWLVLTASKGCLRVRVMVRVLVGVRVEIKDKNIIVTSVTVALTTASVRLLGFFFSKVMHVLFQTPSTPL